MPPQSGKPNHGGSPVQPVTKIHLERSSPLLKCAKVNLKIGNKRPNLIARRGKILCYRVFQSQAIRI